MSEYGPNTYDNDPAGNRPEFAGVELENVLASEVFELRRLMLAKATKERRTQTSWRKRLELDASKVASHHPEVNRRTAEALLLRGAYKHRQRSAVKTWKFRSGPLFETPAEAEIPASAWFVEVDGRPMPAGVYLARAIIYHSEGNDDSSRDEVPVYTVRASQIEGRYRLDVRGGEGNTQIAGDELLSPLGFIEAAKAQYS